MNRLSLIVISLIALSNIGCINENQEAKSTVATEETVKIELSEAEQLIADAIKAHGGDSYKTANISFKFRGNNYRFKNDGNNYLYELTEKKEDSSTWKHTLDNGDFQIEVDGEIKQFDEKKADSYKNALNSVIYFATLPSKLQDPAVIADYKGKTFINDTAYHLVVITFNKEGGGKDFEDQFFYWINSETKLIDYLAYSYKDKEGVGSRFRKAYNRREIGGIIFQDYINYKGAPDVHLYVLAEQFERGELVELSRIETENLKDLR